MRMKNTARNEYLGVYSDQTKVYLFYLEKDKPDFEVRVLISQDGFSFQKASQTFKIKDKDRRPVNFKACNFFRINKVGNRYILTYKRCLKRKSCLYSAESFDLFQWQNLGQVADLKTGGMFLPEECLQKQHILYYGDKALKLAFSPDFKEWQILDYPIHKLPYDYEEFNLEIGDVVLTPKGNLVIFIARGKYNQHSCCDFWAALFETQKPYHLLWQSPQPIWQIPEVAESEKITFLGTVVFQGELIAYWQDEKQNLLAASLGALADLLEKKANLSFLILNKIKENPVLKPIIQHWWESKAVFNPAALYEKGKVHLVYRAIGDNDTSILGYASSDDGINFNKRLAEPVFIPQKLSREKFSGAAFFSPYLSGGGGLGGYEDPRLTRIGNRIYMLYVAYDGCQPPRVALTSIKVEDFLNHQWHWEEPVLISPPGVVDKNACLLPEKIKNKYVIFHRIFPNILIDFVDNLDFDGQSHWLKGEYSLAPRPTYWDSRKVGVGPPPLKTKDGWLMIYHAVGDQDSSRYKIGAMLLDLTDPTKVCYRSDQPILEPNAWYENEGFKAGVAYPCGAVIKNQNLMVYYGGADKVVCAAQAPVNDFIFQLKNTGKAMLHELN